MRTLRENLEINLERTQRKFETAFLRLAPCSGRRVRAARTRQHQAAREFSLPTLLASMGCAGGKPAPSDTPFFHRASEGSSSTAFFHRKSGGSSSTASSSAEALPPAPAPEPQYTGTPPFEDLQDRGLLGTGTYGAVKLVVDRNSRIGYALKVMSKRGTRTGGWSAGALRERRLGAQLHLKHPFICGLVEAYQDERSLYMLLPLATGGELYALLRSQPTPLSPAATCFYVGAVALALGHLHASRIVYRDLKSENIILDERGYPVIIDLGFAKELDPADPHSLTMCGTPAYMAPELVRRVPHGYAVDWWALGILAFECLTGRDPFSTSMPADNTESKIFDRIHKMQYAWPRPNKLHTATTGKPYVNWKELIKSLLNPSALQRLGTRRGGGGGRQLTSAAEDVMAHAAFGVLPAEQHGGDLFHALLRRQIPPPIVPRAARPKGRTKRASELDAAAAADDDALEEPSSGALQNYEQFARAWAQPWVAQPDEDVAFEYMLAPIGRDIAAEEAAAEEAAAEEAAKAKAKAAAAMPPPGGGLRRQLTTSLRARRGSQAAGTLDVATVASVIGGMRRWRNRSAAVPVRT